MRFLGTVVVRFGANAPLLLTASLVVGALAPSVAAPSEAALPYAAFLMTFGSLVAAGLAPRERPEGLLRFTFLILAVAAGPCIATAVMVKAIGLGPDLALGVILAVAGPPLASAAALAAILGLPPRFTLALSVPPTLICPLITPTLVALFTSEVIDATALAIRLVVVVGSAVLAASVVLAVWRRSGLPGLPAVAASGISIIGLAVVGVAAAARARMEIDTDPAAFLKLMIGALILCACLATIAALVFAPLGRARVGTLSLVWGLRNQSYVWVALGATLPMETERFLVAMVLPILVAPLLIRVAQMVRRRFFVAPKFSSESMGRANLPRT